MQSLLTSRTGEEETDTEAAKTMAKARILISGVDPLRIKTTSTVIGDEQEATVYFSNHSRHWKNHLVLLATQLTSLGARILKIEVEP
jgi:hypothetical protein